MTVQISRGFRDISLAFKRHPITNDVTVLKNEDAIKKSVVNLVQTRLDGQLCLHANFHHLVSRQDH